AQAGQPGYRRVAHPATGAESERRSRTDRADDSDRVPRPRNRDQRAPPARGASGVRGLLQSRPTASRPEARDARPWSCDGPRADTVAAGLGRPAPRLRAGRLNSDEVLPPFTAGQKTLRWGAASPCGPDTEVMWAAGYQRVTRRVS